MSGRGDTGASSKSFEIGNQYDFCQIRRMRTSASGPKLNQAALPRDASTTKSESDLPSSGTRRLRTAFTVCVVERIHTLCTRRWADPNDVIACSKPPEECDLISMMMANWASLPSGTSGGTGVTEA